MKREMKIVVKKSVAQPQWFFHLRWNNGRIAMTSELYTRKETAIELAGKIADRLDCNLEVED